MARQYIYIYKNTLAHILYTIWSITWYSVRNKKLHFFFFELLSYIALYYAVRVHFCCHFIRSHWIILGYNVCGVRSIDVRCWFRMSLDLILYHFIRGHHWNIFLCSTALSHVVPFSNSFSGRCVFFLCIHSVCPSSKNKRMRNREREKKQKNRPNIAHTVNHKYRRCAQFQWQNKWFFLHSLGTDMNFKIMPFSIDKISFLIFIPLFFSSKFSVFLLFIFFLSRW